MSDPLDRISLLLSQGRNDLAERDLRRLLASEPQSGYAHGLLSICLLQDPERYVEATEEAEQAVGLEPDDPFSHYALSLAWMTRNQTDRALHSIHQAILMDPDDADFYGVQSRCLLTQDRFQESLDAAQRGLSVDPENSECNNLQSIALERLGRGEEAIAASADTLRRDPDDTMAHAAHGYTLLNSGDYEAAQLAFRESLRLEPSNEMARQGMISALNSRSFFFRLIHRFYVSVSRLGQRSAFALMFGAWVLIRLLQALANQIPAVSPFVTPVIILYVVFALMTWIANPLFNTFLRFHPFGKHLLDRHQRWASNCIAVTLSLAVYSLVACTIVADFGTGFLAAIYWMVVTVGVAATFGMSTNKRRIGIGIATLVVASMPVFGLIGSMMSESIGPFYRYFRYFGFGMLAIQIGSSIVDARPDRK